jgi:hypothetical protein
MFNSSFSSKHWKSWRPMTVSSTRFLKSLSIPTTSCTSCVTASRRGVTDIGMRTADEVHSMSLANLHEEYCTALDTAAVLADG